MEKGKSMGNNLGGEWERVGAFHIRQEAVIKGKEAECVRKCGLKREEQIEGGREKPLRIRSRISRRRKSSAISDPERGKGKREGQ